jgi:hypothetical protein
MNIYMYFMFHFCALLLYIQILNAYHIFSSHQHFREACFLDLQVDLVVYLGLIPSPWRWRKHVPENSHCQPMFVHGVEPRRSSDQYPMWKPQNLLLELSLICNFTARHWQSQSRKRCGWSGWRGFHRHEDWWGLQTISISCKKDWI